MTKQDATAPPPPAFAGEALSADELRAIGELLYGEHWQSDLARALDVGPRTVRFWAAGDPRRPVPAGVAGEIRELAATRLAQIGAWLDRAAPGYLGSPVGAVRFELATGGRIDEACRLAAVAARLLKAGVSFETNGQTLTAEPGMTGAEIYARFVGLVGKPTGRPRSGGTGR